MKFPRRRLNSLVNRTMRNSDVQTIRGADWFRAGRPDVPLAIRMINEVVVEIRLNARAAHSAETPAQRAVARELDEYLAGRRTKFDFPVALHGSPFQQLVWDALRRIPYGQTVTYGELATSIRKPGAARAVGSANGRNPIPLVVPCHRVIAAGGKLGGYGGGLLLKRHLLDMEAGQGRLSKKP